MPALFGLVKLTIVVATQFIVNLFLQHLKNLDFAGLGTVHYEHIQAAPTTDEEAWKGGQLNDEVFIVQQFCQRVVDLLESLKERTGNRIANDVAAVTKSDDPPASASAEEDATIAVRRQMPHVPRVYNALVDRIYGGKNWPGCVKGPFDWAHLFGPEAGDDEDDEYGPWLTPRMAARLHHVAIRDGDEMLDDWKNNPPKLPKVARPFFKISKEWRESFRDCYLRIGMRLQKGLPPHPNCTGEELALHNIIWIAPDADEAMTEDDDFYIFKGLPKFPNDEDYMLVLDNAVDDEDVMMLYDDGDNGYGDSDNDDKDVDNPVLGPGSMASFMLGSGGAAMRAKNLHPSEWFHAFRDEDINNHLP